MEYLSAFLLAIHLFSVWDAFWVLRRIGFGVWHITMFLVAVGGVLLRDFWIMFLLSKTPSFVTEKDWLVMRLGSTITTVFMWLMLRRYARSIGILSVKEPKELEQIRTWNRRISQLRPHDRDAMHRLDSTRKFCEDLKGQDGGKPT